MKGCDLSEVGLNTNEIAKIHNIETLKTIHL